MDTTVQLSEKTTLLIQREYGEHAEVSSSVFFTIKKDNDTPIVIEIPMHEACALVEIMATTIGYQPKTRASKLAFT